MFLRRLKYMFTGRLMRMMFGLISLIIVVVIAILFLFGVINQKDFVGWIFNGMLKGGEATANMIEDVGEGGGPVKITSDGVYINGYEPEGAGEVGEDTNFFNSFKENYVDKVGEVVDSMPASGAEENSDTETEGEAEDAETEVEDAETEDTETTDEDSTDETK